MNITIFAAVDFPAGPATTSRIRHIAKILIAAGHDVTVGSLQANTKVPNPENISVSGIHDGIRFVYLNGDTVRPSRLFEAVADTLKGSIGALTYLRKMKREGRVDLVLYYTPDFFQILPSLLFAKLRRIPVVLELCEVNSAMRIASFKQRIRLLGAALTDRLLPRISSGVIVISSRIRHLLQGNGVSPTKIFHLPILVDYRVFSRQSATPLISLSGKRYFLNSGALGEKDGVEYLLDAFALICRQHDDVYLVFTGEPDSRRKQQIMESARASGIGEKVIFTGFLSNNQLIWSYQNAVGLLCCRNNSQYANYGSPNKLSEYLATGRPVVTNQVGDNNVYVIKNRNAFVANVEDHVSIAEQMHLILTRPDTATMVGNEGQELAKRTFNYENYVTPLDSFLRVCADFHN